MKRGGGILVAAVCCSFLLCGVSSPLRHAPQESETGTGTPTGSDFFIPTPTGTPSAGVSETGTCTDTPTPTLWPTPILSPTDTATPSTTASVMPTPTETPTGTDTPLMTASPGGTDTQTTTDSPTAGSAPGRVIISEVAWAGTAASVHDEWIELWNPGGTAVDLGGWVLTDNGDIHIALSGSIGSGSYFLLERTDDTTVGNIAADRIYTGALSNAGESLFLIDSSGSVADSANGGGGSWPAGNAVPNGSMERRGDAPDAPSAWCSNDGIHRNGSDAGGQPINGTPRQPFSGFCGGATPTLPRTRTPTPTGSQTADGTSTATPTVIRTPFPPHSVVINEVAWAGTAASSADEWIELWNPGTETIGLNGWVLTDGGDVAVDLEGSIEPGGFYLLERSDDDTLSDIAADRIFAGSLANAGEELILSDPTGAVIDAAGGRPWPGGTAAPMYASMERAGVESAFWASNTGWLVNGRDADGRPVRGTPGRANSVLFPTPTATKIPRSVRINEFLPKPGSDWNQDGYTDYFDEFIELLNTGSDPVEIGGWMLDDQRGGGSRPYVIPGGTWIQPNEFKVFFRRQTRIALNDGGDEIWLLGPDGSRLDGRAYTRTRWPDSAWGRFPDGVSVLRLGFPPTPGEPNRLPDDILHPVHEPLPVIAGGWRRVICGSDAGPLLVGDGFLTTGTEESARMAEAQGWLIWWDGKCYAWSEPTVGRWAPYTNLLANADSPLEGGGWWWESWFLR